MVGGVGGGCRGHSGRGGTVGGESSGIGSSGFSGGSWSPRGVCGGR